MALDGSCRCPICRKTASSGGGAINLGGNAGKGPMCRCPKLAPFARGCSD